MHPKAKHQLGNTDSLIINTRSKRQLVESQFNAVYLKLIMQKDGNDRSLALRAKLLSMTLFLL